MDIQEQVETRVLLSDYVKKLRKERDDKLNEIDRNHGLDKAQKGDLKKGIIVNYSRKLDIVVDKVIYCD